MINKINAGLEPGRELTLPEAGALLSRQEVSRLADAAVVELQEVLNLQRLAVLSCSAGGGRLIGAATLGFDDPEFREWSIQAEEAPTLFQALQSAAPGVLLRRELPDRLRRTLVDPVVALPLIVASRPLAIGIGQLTPGVRPDSHWRSRAQELSARVALTIELQRIASDYDEEIHRRQYTREIGAAILEGAPLREVAGLIVEIISRRLRLERVGLFLRDSSGLILPAALRGISPEFGRSVARMTQRKPLPARGQATGLPLYSRNVAQDTRFSPEMRALLEREGVGACLMAMLQHREDLRGALVAYPEPDRNLTPLELSAFEAFADMATLGVAISQQMEQGRETATTEERNRLAREMHDTVARSLTALLLQLEMAQASLDQKDLRAAQEMLAPAVEQTRSALQETRRAVQGLAPAALDLLSAAQAVAQEVSSFEARSSINARFVQRGEEERLRPEQELALLRVTQEALENARRHSGAAGVRVGLTYATSGVTLVVEDDGAGFDVQAPRSPGEGGGYGLFGMEERAMLAGGSLEVESTPGWGTQVKMKLPYRRLASEEMEFGSLPAQPVLAHERRAPAAEQAPAVDAPLPAGATRVLIVDDHALARQGMRSLLESTGEVAVVGEAIDGAEGELRARELQPDLVLMDLQMPDADGLEGLRRMQASLPSMPVVILTTFDSPESVAAALQAGARGFLLKDAGASELAAAIRAARSGETVLAPGISARLAGKKSDQDARRSATEINEREAEVLRLLARGARNREIGAALFIAPKTVEYHLRNIFDKLGVSNRTEAVRAALERGLA